MPQWGAIMNIREEAIQYEENNPISVSILNIKHYRTHFHKHEVEMVFCLQGYVKMQSSHRELKLKEGDIFSIDPGDIHCLYSENDNVIVLIHIDIPKLNLPVNIFDNCFFACETQYCEPFQLVPMQKIKNILLTLAYLKVSQLEASKYDYEKLAYKIMDLLIKHFDWLSFIWDPYDENVRFQERFHRIMEYCSHNYSEKITISQIAKSENINANYLSQFMKKTTFEGFKSMIEFIRCYNAEILLLTTDETAIEISYQCGFSSPKYFYRNFKKWWNKTPIKLRQWYLQYDKCDHDITEINAEGCLPLINNKMIEEYITASLE